MARGLADGMVKDFYVGMQIEEEADAGISVPTTSARQFSITPSVSGKSTWDLDVDGPLTLDTAGSWAIVPLNSFNVDVLAWGGGGATRFSWNGGAGGFAGGEAFLEFGYAYSGIVGSAGVTAGGTRAYGGGGGTGSAGGSGGGYSGLLKALAALLLAGGGGGCGFGGSGGGGGGSSGENGTIFTEPGTNGKGGTSTAGGANGGSPSTAGTSLLGGTGASETSNYHGGGGGGGYYGGGGGNFISGSGGSGGGGGGSGFADPVNTAGVTLTAAVGTTPGNSGHGSRGTAGNPDAVGKVIIS